VTGTATSVTSGPGQPTVPTTSTPAKTVTATHTQTVPTTGSSDVRLPATFTVRSGERLSPPAISAPGGVTIVLTVVSGDGRAHNVVVGGPASRSLSVPAGGRASVELAGVRNGTYPIAVDGHAEAGSLTVGVAPGP
jgi:hypothetical protein